MERPSRPCPTAAPAPTLSPTDAPSVTPRAASSDPSVHKRGKRSVAPLSQRRPPPATATLALRPLPFPSGSHTGI